MRFTLVATTLAVLSVSCTVSLQDLCGRRVPALDRQISEARSRLEPARAGRTIASAKLRGALNEEERDTWRSWSEVKLREAQVTMDEISAYPQARPLKQELSDMANDLVAFHGYAQAGNATQMALMLERIQTRSRKAAVKACGSEFALDASVRRP